MPEPEWANLEYDPTEPANVGAEILGRGAANRKSKTYFQEVEMAVILGLIRGHYRRLVEAFRRLHARKHTRVVVIPQGEQVSGATLMELCRDDACPINPSADGDAGVRHLHEPEVLTDAQIHRLYPSTYEWLQMHQEQVDHAASLKGFSVRAASGLDMGDGGSSRGDSSAGADRARQRQARGDDGAKWR